MSEVLRPYRDLFPQIGPRVMIDDSSVVIGDVRLADDVGIWPLVVIRGDVHYVQIGARTNIQDGSMLHVTHKSSYNPAGNPLTIGEDVTIGHKVMLHGCTIGNRVLVGMGSILLDGAIVEDDVMIGAGSLVPQNKRLESGYLYLGSPVKQIRPLSDEEKAGLRYSANNYVKWKETIGEDVTVGHKVMLHGCTIGNRVLVGMGSILLDGAIVEDDVMIGAGSLVPQNKRLESGYLYLGSPVKQIRPLSDEEKAGLRYSANNYVKWKDEYLDQGNQTQP